MKIYQVKSCLMVALLLSVAISCSMRKEAKTSLEGRWTGYDLTATNATDEVTVAGHQLDYHGPETNDWARGTFVLDEQTQPMELDFTIQESPHDVGKRVLGIYELQGDNLKIAVAPPGDSQRPLNFTPGPNTRVMIYKRQ
jgi:uncharacterized protein (TIGR03067 family)